MHFPAATASFPLETKTTSVYKARPAAASSCLPPPSHPKGKLPVVKECKQGHYLSILPPELLNFLKFKVLGATKVFSEPVSTKPNILKHDPTKGESEKKLFTGAWPEGRPLLTPNCSQRTNAGSSAWTRSHKLKRCLVTISCI